MQGRKQRHNRYIRDQVRAGLSVIAALLLVGVLAALLA